MEGKAKKEHYCGYFEAKSKSWCRNHMNWLRLGFRSQTARRSILAN
ncbi:MAG: hypothetical protein ACI8YI_001231, partial [Paracoccaceae bacterium]